MKDPYYQPRWSKPTQPVSPIDYRKTVDKHTKSTTSKKIREENLNLKNSYRDEFLWYFSSFAFPLWPKWFPLVFLFVCFVFSPIFPSSLVPRATWIMNLQCNHRYSSTKIPGRKSMFLAKVTQIKGTLWYKKSGEMTFMFLPLSLPLCSHHLVLRVAPVMHNYG